MKKRFFNPQDMFFIILFLFIEIAILLGLVVKLIIDVVNHLLLPENLWIAILVILLFSVVGIVLCLFSLRKYSGYFFECDECIVFKKGKKQEKVAIKEIKRFEIKPYVRVLGGWKSDRCRDWQFVIILNSKEKLPFLITNKKIMEIVNKWTIHAIPKEFAEQITADLKTKETAKNKSI